MTTVSNVFYKNDPGIMIFVKPVPIILDYDTAKTVWSTTFSFANLNYTEVP